MLSLVRSGEAFPFLGEAERERERERDLLSADADRSLQERSKEIVIPIVLASEQPRLAVAYKQMMCIQTKPKKARKKES